jgi:carbonic anhydrase/acetyltransferase-like protein (isoleucine patch superfamily)
MPIFDYRGSRPRLGTGVFLASTAVVTGEVEIGDDVSFWFHSVARGDVNKIHIGERSNIQDGAVLHVTHKKYPLRLGAEVVVGHGAILHGCTVGDGALIGIGARVLDGAVVEAGSQVGAGALVTPGQTVPSGHLVLGVPARVVRPLTQEEQSETRKISHRYLEVKNSYLEQMGRGY